MAIPTFALDNYSATKQEYLGGRVDIIHHSIPTVELLLGEMGKKYGLPEGLTPGQLMTKGVKNTRLSANGYSWTVQVRSPNSVASVSQTAYAPSTTGSPASTAFTTGSNGTIFTPTGQIVSYVTRYQNAMQRAVLDLALANKAVIVPEDQFWIGDTDPNSDNWKNPEYVQRALQPIDDIVNLGIRDYLVDLNTAFIGQNVNYANGLIGLGGAIHSYGNDYNAPSYTYAGLSRATWANFAGYNDSTSYTSANAFTPGNPSHPWVIIDNIMKVLKPNGARRENMVILCTEAFAAIFQQVATQGLTAIRINETSDGKFDVNLDQMTYGGVRVVADPNLPAGWLFALDIGGGDNIHLVSNGDSMINISKFQMTNGGTTQQNTRVCNIQGRMQLVVENPWRCAFLNNVYNGNGNTGYSGYGLA